MQSENKMVALQTKLLFQNLKMLNIKISDYNSIGKADINVDGITVLAGPNGCGKSTLSRWVFYFLNVSKQFKSLLTKDCQLELDTLRKNMDSIFSYFGNEKGKDMGKSMEKVIVNIPTLTSSQVEEAFNKYAEAFSSMLLSLDERNQKTVENDFYFSQAFANMEKLGKYPKDASWEEKVRYLKDRLVSVVVYWLQYIDDSMVAKDLYRLQQYVRDVYGEQDEMPQTLQLTDNGAELIPFAAHDCFRPSMSFDNVCYVDSPMSATTATTDKLWMELQQTLKKGNANITNDAKFILKYIAQKIGGKTTVEKDSLGFESELFYYEGDRKMSLAKAATGVKTFAYIERLIENGTLTNRTLLLIDEPEAHLHPQWIVEYARVLVMLHKRIGVTIMVASHNPDMVAAIREVSEAEGIGNKTRFYLAEERDGRYDYRDLKQDISDIFTSFNIAISKIEEYGSGNNKEG